ncbi:OmpA family protein [Neiella marina]|uniref:OmpA family protein n=1 Tax=Neiella holothuriorum TaxID=2870530 RepID=A0ABS7EG54_9GAMM|nr:OmpA family protein [Neiella holothuriorum]MBW8191319.1 OmpA family protein [Neiella holothuriorum]
MYRPALLSSLIILVTACSQTDPATPVAEFVDVLTPPAPLSSDQQKRLTHHSFFIYDEATLSREDFESVQAHAQYIAQNKELIVLVAGHADERGTDEYNHELGMRRAQAVARALRQNGVAEHQLILRSYASNKPIAHRGTEHSHRLNRRATIIY